MPPHLIEQEPRKWKKRGMENIVSQGNHDNYGLLPLSDFMVRVGMMNELRQNETKTTIQQVMLYPCMVFRITMVDDKWSGDC
jgi:hypothetical protein